MDSYLLAPSGILQFVTTSGNYMRMYLTESNNMIVSSRDNGSLFSVLDSTGPSIFAATTSAGLPIIEAFSDGTVSAGRFGYADFLISGGNTSLGFGPQAVAKLLIKATSDSVPALILRSSSPLQTGSFFSMQNSSSTELFSFRETSSTGEMRVGLAATYLGLRGNAGSGTPGITSSSAFIHMAVDINGTAGSEVLGIRKSTSGARVVEFKNTAGTAQSAVLASGNFASLGSLNISFLDYTFLNDTDTGFYRNANNSLSFVASGISYMSINASGVLIGPGTYANSKAALEISSTTQGFLPPRLTTTQKNNITSPTVGLMIYDSVLDRPAIYTLSGWQTFSLL